MKIPSKYPLIPFFFFLLPCLSFAQVCDTTTEVTLQVFILTDDYPYETSWEVIGTGGVVYEVIDLDATFQKNTEYTWDVCIPKGECVTFTIYDEFGDGIELPGYYTLELDDVEMVNSTLKVEEAKHELNCPQGQACNSAHLIDLGVHTAVVDNSWYIFTPDTTGLFTISTCNFTTCDTKIWLFQECATAHNDEGNEGTLIYDDNFGGCGEQASITTSLPKGEPIYIRIGDDNDDCAGAALDWEISYKGPVSGCTDINSCNYDPLASVDDGSCLPFGDPACPSAPDLLVRQDKLISSAYLSQVEATDACLIEEGCLNGYGMRDIIRFSTYIENIGDADYFIGAINDQSGQFTFDNCHNHWHYDGYAEYVLYDENGVELPIGFKNGFCVIDLGCSSGTAQYNCSYMGISAGCFDEYWAELECQWIDITDVPDGRYTFVTRVNWDNAPDALGRKEKDTLNNWAQMCIILDRSSGSLEFIQDDDCDPFKDCNGVLFGNAEYDCAGICEGTAKWGDLNSDGDQSTADVLEYVEATLQSDPAAATCMDLSGDGEISVYDAALMADCAIYGEAYHPIGGGEENHCIFPRSLSNPNHTAGLTILEYDVVNNYFDIAIKSIEANIIAYQFYMTGLTITKVENLVDPNIYPGTPWFNADGMVLGVSTLDSVVIRNPDWQSLVRVYHDGNLEQEVCLRQIREIVNQEYELIDHYIETDCISFVATSQEKLNADWQVAIFPNPFSNKTILTFTNPAAKNYDLRITDINGKILQTITDIREDRILIDGTDFVKGVYLYQLIGAEGMATGKLVVE